VSAGYARSMENPYDALMDCDPLSRICARSHCRGLVLYQWATRVEERWGKAERKAIEDRLSEANVWVPDSPSPRFWYPIQSQVLIVDSLVSGPLGGDGERLGEYLCQDVTNDVKGAMGHLLRSIGPSGLFRQGSSFFPRLYDFGTLDVYVERRWARLHYRGHEIFEVAAWQVLQRAVVETVLRFCGKKWFQIDQDTLDPKSLILTCRW
jgi:hypothetical protein